MTGARVAAVAGLHWSQVDEEQSVLRIPSDRMKTWTPGKVGGWQPAAWSHHPFDEASQKIRAGDTFINFGDTFTVLQSGESGIFRSALVALPPTGNPADIQELWLNTAKFQRGRWTAWVSVQPTQLQRASDESSSRKRIRRMEPAQQRTRGS